MFRRLDESWTKLTRRFDKAEIRLGDDKENKFEELANRGIQNTFFTKMTFCLPSDVRKTLLEHMNEITPLYDYLSVSGCLPVNKKVLLKNGYTGAVCCIREFEYEFPPEIDYLHIKVDDTRDTDLTVHFDRVSDLIERQRVKGGRTLVFCGQGVSRSVSFCLAYMIKYTRTPLDEAYDYIRMRRAVVCPNLGFFKQLINLEKQEIGKTTVKIIRPAPELEVADIVWRRSLELLKAVS